jgi:hypothetical protein
MKITLCSVVVALVCFGALGAVGVSVPGEALLDAGNGDVGLFDAASRAQQIFNDDGDTFPQIPSDSAFLKGGASARANELALPGSGSALISGLDVRLSTTCRGLDALSTVFSENIGPDETTVFSPGPLTLDWSAGSFVTVIPQPATFCWTYEITPLPHFLALDAFAAPGDSESSVSTGMGADSQTGGIAAYSFASVFWADIVPVPEPAPATFILCGLLGLAWKLRRFHKASSSRR